MLIVDDILDPAEWQYHAPFFVLDAKAGYLFELTINLEQLTVRALVLWSALLIQFTDLAWR